MADQARVNDPQVITLLDRSAALRQRSRDLQAHAKELSRAVSNVFEDYSDLSRRLSGAREHPDDSEE